MTGKMRMLKLLTGLGILALAAFLARGSVTPAHAVFNDSDGDGNIDLVEQITGSDPQNAASTPEDISIDLLFGGNSCNDGIDNNGDGLTDSADPGCTDSDHDFISNAMETRLGSDPNDNTNYPESSQFDAMLSYFGVGFAITCGDAADNDHDGLTDGADPGCVQIQNDGDNFSDATEKLFGSDPTDPNSVPEHEIANPGSCTDGIDNDLDGLTDSADPGCQPAPNDSFANATSISSLPYDDSEKISSSTRSPTDPYSSCASPGSLTVWYRYTAASDDVLVVSTAGSSFGANLSVWTTSGGRLSEVACAGTYRTVGSVHAAFRATAGQTYYVLVGGDIGPGSPAMLGFHLSVGTPPANDDFGDAETISALPFTTTVDTTAATTETSEPNCYYGRPISSVWYRFAPAQDTLVVADAGESSFFPILGVWTSGIFGLTPTACSVSNGSASQASRVAFLARAGQTYYVQAGGDPYSPTTSGTLDFSLDVGISPANDNFAGATNVSSLPFNDSVDTFTATTELNDPLASCTYGDYPTRTIWYRYTATADGYVEADLGSDFNYALYITAYEGSSLDSLSEVACAANGANKIGFAATAGHSYYVLVAGRTYRGGKFISTSGAAGGGPPSSTLVTFHMDTLTIPPCATPSFSFTDAVGDTSGGFGPPPPGTEPPDIVLVTGGNDARNVCVRVEFAAPVPPVAAGTQQPSLALNFDGSEFPGRDLTCPYSPASELQVYVPIPSNILVPLYGFLGPDSSTGYALFGDRSVTVIVPLSAVGGDDHYRVTAYTNNGSGSDCAPDVGAIQSPPAQLGDANCDGRTDSIDSLLILQLFANIIPMLPCQYAGDVNYNGGVGPIDALLILQYESGMFSFPIS